MIKIVVDGMGGDQAPEQVVKGCVDALNKKEGFTIVLTGDEDKIKAELAKYKFDAERLVFVPTTEVISNDDVPTKAIRTKKDSSLVVALNLLKTDPEVGALVSAGSTGAVLTGGILMIGRLKGVSRPALCPGVPNVRGGVTLLCDCGANVECKPVNFVHFAIMASAYAKTAFGVENPKVGLLNNGAEDHKGDPLHQEVNALLKKIPGINYVGNVEGNDLMFGDVDVMVADGFSGNVALKAVEGCGRTVKTVLKREFSKNLGRKISYLAAKSTIDSLSYTLDSDNIGGAVFLGMKKVMVKAHGTCRAKAITPAILLAFEACKGGLTDRISEMLAHLDLSEIDKMSENVNV